MPPEYLIGLDLGQSHDFTAVVVVERHELPTGRFERVQNAAAWFDGGHHLPRVVEVPQVAGAYDVVHVERFPLTTSYTAMPARLHIIRDQVRQRWADAVWQELQRGVSPRNCPVSLIADKTGVGAPVIDLLHEHGLDPISVSITGGAEVHRPAVDAYNVPKRMLVSTIQVLLQSRRLRWSAALPEAMVLQRELEGFKARISLSGHDSYGNFDDWREGSHDDTVLALALAVWYGEHTHARGGETMVTSYLGDPDDDDGRFGGIA